MKLRIEPGALADAVTWAGKALATKPATPVLAGLRITATAGTLADGEVTVSGFDYETSARCTVAADVTDPGQVLVSGRLLADIVKTLPAKPVDLAVDGTRVTLACGSAKFKLLTMPVSEYPTLPDTPGPVGRLGADLFAQAVAQVTVAASRDETVPLLGSVRMEATGGRLALLATDRYRLAVRELDLAPVVDDLDIGVLVRARNLADVAKALPAGATVGVGLTDTMVGFDVGTRQTTSLLTDGQYPQVRALFPDEFASTAVVETELLAAAVKRMALVAEQNTPIRLGFDGGTLTLEAGRGQDASGVEHVEVTTTGDVPAVAFNPQFLLDGLGAVDTPFVRLSFTKPNKPVVLTGQALADGDDDVSYRYLLMPVRLQDGTE